MVSENAPKYQAEIAFVFVKAVVIVATATVEFVLDVITA